MKNGVIQRWGLVEFQKSCEAETTMDMLNGQLVNGQPIRVQVTNKPSSGEGFFGQVLQLKIWQESSQNPQKADNSAKLNKIVPGEQKVGAQNGHFIKILIRLIYFMCVLCHPKVVLKRCTS